MGLLIVHHDPLAGLARLADPLGERTLETTELQGTEGPWPDPAGLAGVLVLGGRMSVAGDDLEPWVEHELDFLRAAEAAEVPVLGICLGAQLLALAHGGTVVAREAPEADVVAVHRTEVGMNDPITAGWVDGSPAIMYHNDEVLAIPDDAEQLLLGSDGPTMWRVGHAHATQMHPEVGAEDVLGWMDDFGDELVTRAGDDPELFRAELTRRDSWIQATGVALVMRWVDSLDW